MMRTWVARRIQRKHGYKPVPFTCPECGLVRPSVDSFPTSNIVGLSALAWAASGGRIWSTGVACPGCGKPMTVDEELARRVRKRPSGRNGTTAQ
jgi:predicted RNA-binding Zn-ribbon protein involved in translation (DUF1610 family)